MYTTTNESGQLNNYAKLPAMYYAAPPNRDEQRRYWAQGAVAAVLVGISFVVAFAASAIA